MKHWFNLKSSVKEAFDNLPSGICIFDHNGMLVLCNQTMYRLIFDITGRDLQNISDVLQNLRSLIQEGRVVWDDGIYCLPDRHAWSFEIKTIKDEFGVVYIQVIASDVTKLYYGSIELAENIENLKDMQTHIQSMKNDITVTTRENEILSIKMKIHDELGSSLLKLRRFYLGTGNDSKAQLLANWKNTVAMLKYKSGGEDAVDPMEDLMRSAAAIGVRIVQDGALPEDLAAARLIVRAIRQCLTNAVKHAGGNEIYVELRQNGGTASVVITNDGVPPTSEIVEGGGLSSLRRHVEKAGGMMMVQSFPVFALEVILPVADGSRGTKSDFE